MATSQVPGQLPQAVGGTALHVATDSDGCGIVQTFAAPDGPPDPRAHLSVAVPGAGSVAVGTGAGGSTGRDVICDQTGHWVLIQAENGGSPASELVIYAAGDDGAEFYADHVWVTVLDMPLVPVDSPPARTVTWFHLGPVGPAIGGWTDSGALTGDYWPGDPPLQPYLDQTAIPGAAYSPQVREALRGSAAASCAPSFTPTTATRFTRPGPTRSTSRRSLCSLCSTQPSRPARATPRGSRPGWPTRWSPCTRCSAAVPSGTAAATR